MTFKMRIEDAGIFRSKSAPMHVVKRPASEKLMANLNPKINITQEAYPVMKRMFKGTSFDSPSFQNFVAENSKVITKRLSDMGHEVGKKLTLSSVNIKDVFAIVKDIAKKAK